MKSGSSDPALHVRRGSEQDLASIERIQAASPQAACWNAREYLNYDLWVAEWDGRMAGFAVARKVAEDEGELLNLAVDPDFRRRGIARRLVAEITSSHREKLWLEVRESNLAARNLYKSLGFMESGVRPGYYADSDERAIVMNVHS